MSRRLSGSRKARGCLTVIDNTWATPLFFKPPKFGIDIGIYAATKYICGHSDIMMGIVTCRAALHHPLAKMAHGTLGHAAAPDECYQALRGLRTLHARLTQHQETALTLARWLAQRPEVEQVLHPALPGTPGHEFWKRDVGGSSGLFGVVLKPCAPDRVDAMLNGMRLFGMGYSWGGYESLMVPAGLTTSRSAKPWPAVGRTDAHPCRPGRSRRPDRRSGRRPCPAARKLMATPQEFLDSVAFDANGLVPAIAQQHDTGEVLMMAWMNRAAIEETLSTGRVCYWSRSRASLWRKGETSGQITAPGRAAHRLRQRLPAGAGGPDRRRLPHRAALLLLHRVRGGERAIIADVQIAPDKLYDKP